jgi:hypothetical protein
MNSSETEVCRKVQPSPQNHQKDKGGRCGDGTTQKIYHTFIESIIISPVIF